VPKLQRVDIAFVYSIFWREMLIEQWRQPATTVDFVNNIAAPDFIPPRTM
jgi:hypothetical protein